MNPYANPYEEGGEYGMQMYGDPTMMQDGVGTYEGMGGEYYEEGVYEAGEVLAPFTTNPNYSSLALLLTPYHETHFRDARIGPTNNSTELDPAAEDISRGGSGYHRV